MDSTARSRFKGAESILMRSKSLYDGTKNTMRLSTIKSKLQTVSSSLANSSPFSSVAKDKETSDFGGSYKSIRSERDEVEKGPRERVRTHPRGTSTTQKQKGDPEKKRSKRTGRHRKVHVKTTATEDSNTVSSSTPSTQVVLATEDYTVNPGDTVTSVAARFDVTPSELCRINRLFCRSLFPGQTIKVPKASADCTDRSETEVCNTRGDESSLGDLSDLPDRTRTKTDEGCSEQTPDSGTQLEPGVEVRQFVGIESSTEDRVNENDNTDEDNDDQEDDDEMSSMQSDESYESDEEEDFATEENDPMAAQYLKLESEYIVNLQSAIPGLLLFTTNSLMFNPERNGDGEEFHLLLPLSRLRSIAAYADHSVMYFTKRDLQSKSKSTRRRRHQTDQATTSSGSDSRSTVKMTSNKSDSAIFLHEVGKEADSEDMARVHDEIGKATEVTNNRTTTTTPTDSKHPAANHYLLPTTNLTHKSKSADFSSEHGFAHADKPVCSLPDLEHPDSVVYLCVLANPNGSILRRHPHWFTIQSMEYWFRVPERKADILFDFLLACDFREEQSAETAQNITSKDDAITHQSDSGNVSTAAHIHGSKTTPANLFRTNTGASKATGFVVVPNTFDWVLPRIGSIDECSKLMLKRSLRRKQRRTQSCKEPSAPGLVFDSSLPDQSSKSLLGSVGVLRDDFKTAVSAPSLEEEKTALQILKRESVRWEWIRAPLRVLWSHIAHWLVNASELENEQENAKRRQFILNCIQMAQPENLPLPLSTEQSAILDATKVRDLMRNLPSEAEGRDWQLTYSTALHGFSLRTLYHRCTMAYADELPEPKSLISTNPIIATSPSGTTPFSANEPCLLVIRTSMDDIFGAMLNTHLYSSSGRFYGNGSCFVFRWVLETAQHPRGKDHTPHPRLTIVEPDTRQLANHETSLDHPDMTQPVESPRCSVGSRTSRRSTSSVSDTDSSMFLEQGEEMTEDFARLFYLDESEDQEFSCSTDKPQQKTRFQKFCWTGKNTFFIGGENDSLTIGCSRGHSAIHLDDVLLHGRTETCETFDNDPLCASQDFLVSNLEIWSFL